VILGLAHLIFTDLARVVWDFFQYPMGHWIEPDEDALNLGYRVAGVVVIILAVVIAYATW